MCNLTSCSSVLCVLMALIGHVCESYVVFDKCDVAPSLFVFPVRAYGGVMWYVWCFSFLCEFCAVYEVF